MSGARVVVAHTMQEALRRRVFLVVGLLSVAFLALFSWAAIEAFDTTEAFGSGSFGVDAHELTGATLMGLSLFVTLFLGSVLAVFLTQGTVRGDAERGLLQPLVVRPLGRVQLLAARWAAAAAVCAGYAMAMILASMLIAWASGEYWPDRILAPALQIGGAVAVVAALSVLGSVFLSVTANGVAVFMTFGAGLTGGLLGQIGEGIDSERLESISETVSWLLPFEALYQGALSSLIADAGGLTEEILSLGPFGGAQVTGPLLVPWTVVYLGLVIGAAAWAFARRDL